MPEKKKIKLLAAQDVSVFFDSMAMLLRAGIIAAAGPGIVAADMDGGRLQQACQTLDSLLSDGQVYTLSEAMKKSGQFPAYATELVRLGEVSGRLENTCVLLARYYARQAMFERSMRSAAAGPLLLLAMMSLVLFFLILYVLPVFERVFKSLGAASAGGMRVAFVASHISLVVVGLVLVLVLVMFILYLIPSTKGTAMAIARVFPPVRRIMYTLSAAKFTQGLSMLLASGINSVEALDKATELVNDRDIVENMPACKALLEKGENVGKALVESGVLRGFEARVLLSAARAGKTTEAMDSVADQYSHQVESEIDALLGLLEPTLVGILSIAIGIVLLSIMLPLTGVMSALT